MLRVGDVVIVEKSARIDACFQAWSFIDSNPKALVKQKMEYVETGAPKPEGEELYALEWEQEFSGGHSCQGTCADRRGQYFAEKHLSLCFEESRDVQTVPNIEIPE